MTWRRAVALALLAALGALGAGTTTAAAPAAFTALVKDEAGHAVEEAVVSLTPLDRGAAATPRGTRAVMDQIDRQFVPHVLAVGAGTAIAFPNRDNIRHHVYSFSAAKKFELPLYIGTPSAPVVFDKPGVVVLGCNIHDWMVGYIYVLATPYFAKTGTNGAVTVDAVPPGRYEARVWHPRMRGEVDKTARPVAIGAGEPGNVAFVLSLKPKQQAPPRGPGRYEGTQGGG